MCQFINKNNQYYYCVCVGGGCLFSNLIRFKKHFDELEAVIR